MHFEIQCSPLSAIGVLIVSTGVGRGNRPSAPAGNRGRVLRGSRRIGLRPQFEHRGLWSASARLRQEFCRQRCALPDRVDESRENVGRVVWAGTGLRVKLHRHDLFVRVNKPLDALIVQVDVGDFRTDALK